VRDLERVERKQPKVRESLQRLVARLRVDPFEGDVDPVPGFSHRVWKARMPSPDGSTGKRGGYRVDYDADKTTFAVTLLYMWHKNERADMLKGEVEVARERAGLVKK
jgi:mRNA-degrading endonuclease RelE of RelBE toxin-antitoxin system